MIIHLIIRLIAALITLFCFLICLERRFVKEFDYIFLWFHFALLIQGMLVGMALGQIIYPR